MLWFRHYTEALHDPKIRSLRPELQLAVYHIWELVALQDGAPFTVDILAYGARYRRDWAARCVRDLLQRGLLDACPEPHLVGYYLPHNWLKRQYKSDTSKDRTREWRRRKRNVTVTAPDTETEVLRGKSLKDLPRAVPAERVTRDAAEAAASGGSLGGSPPAAAAEAERLAERKRMIEDGERILNGQAH